MCIMMTEHEPSSTRLISIPVGIGKHKYRLLIYTNDLEVGDKKESMWDAFGRMNYQSTSIDNSALMIVAIPNIYNVDDFGLVNVNTDKMKSFRRELKDLFTIKTNSLSRGLYFTNSVDTIRVNRIGNYDISVAPDLQSLEERIDWSHFKLPHDFEQRKQTLSNKNLYPFDCAFVVAKAVKSVKNVGFGILYPDPKFDYFPTSHEDTSASHSYDVHCYNFTKVKQSIFPFKTNKTNFVSGDCHDNKEDITRILNYLDGKCSMSKTGSSGQYYLYEIPNYINHCYINENAPNQNIVLYEQY